VRPGDGAGRLLRLASQLTDANADPEAAVRFAREHLRESDVRLWPGASHSLPFEEAEAVDQEMLAFMARHDE
jgi:pimeloyl-ACP methyl ester carboxylesterase